MSVGIPPVRGLLFGWGAQLQGDERWLLQRIVILERNDAFQQQRPLRPLSDMGGLARFTTHLVMRVRAHWTPNNTRKVPEG